MTTFKKLNKTITTTLITLLMLSMMIGLIHLTSATTTIAIALSPTSGSAGTAVTVTATAGNFSSGETVRTYWGPSATIVNTTVAAGDGSLSATFTVPSASPGAYAVTSVGASSTNSATAYFTVSTLSLTLASSWAIPASLLNVTGAGFTVNGLIRITFGTTSVANVSATSSGALNTLITVPSNVPGTYTITATDASSGSSTTQNCIIPVPTVTILPTSGASGLTGIAVTGGNFTSGGAVQVYFGSTSVVNTTANTPINGNISTTFNVPSSQAGPVTVKVFDVSTTYNVTATFTVSTPTLTLTPAVTNSFFPGESISFTGNFYTVSSPIGIYFGNVGSAVATPTSNGTGYISGSFIIPAGTLPGAVTVKAFDTAANFNTSKTLTVTTPKFTSTPNGGAPGATVTLSGGPFSASTTINIYWGTNLTNTVATPTTDVNGNFTGATFTVPTVAVGTYTITAKDTSTTYNATSTYTVGPVINSLNPTSGVPGQSITIIGTGFAVNQTAQVYFDSALLTTINVNSTGGISGPFIVPSLASGTHNVTVLDVNTTLVTSITQFNINAPGITATPNNGFYPVNVVIASSAPFAVSTTVSIYFNGVLMTTAKSSNSGNLPGLVNFNVPSIVSGNYTILATDGINSASTFFLLTGTGGVDTLTTTVNAIQATLNQFGSFWNFTNTWFTTINTKLGTFVGSDTVASLLYAIKANTDNIKLNPDALRFDFGGPQAAFQTNYIHITNTAAYSANVGYGWTSTTGLNYINRNTANFGETSLVYSSVNNTVFQVDLPNGNYTVMVTQGDASSAHDNMVVTVGTSTATVSTAAGGFTQTVFTANVTGGNLQITFGKAAGFADPNWVVNGLVISRSWNK